MKKNTLIFSILLFFLLSFSIKAQYALGPDTSIYKRYVQRAGTNNPVLSDFIYNNNLMPVGNTGSYHYYRGLYQWNIPDSLIPDNSQIDTVEIFFIYNHLVSNSYGHFFYLNIGEDLQNSNVDTLWNRSSPFGSNTLGEGYGNKYSDEGYSIDTVYSVFGPDSKFCNAIKNSLLYDKFILGIVKVYEYYDGAWHIYCGSLTIRIVFTPPNQLVTLDQRLSNNTLVGKLRKWEGSNWGNNINPDTSFNFPVNSEQIILGDQTIISNQKYHRWVRNSVNESNIMNHHSFIIQSFDNNFTSRFEPTQLSITIKNSLEGTSVSGGNIQLRDPWFIDYPDPNYGNQLRNRGIDSALFYSRVSPFLPDYSTPYNGKTYKGVFLNQPYTGNNPVYYSVKSDATQPIDLGGPIGTRDCYFQNWSADPPGSAEFQNADALETPVVFKSENATVQANYKVHLFTNSTSATAPNNQRKIVQGSNGYWSMVYVSMDQVWLSRSTDGINWEKEIWISDYVNGDINGCPSIDVYNDQAYIVWQNIYWVGISGWNTAYINVRRYDLSNNTLGPTITAASFEPPTESYASTPVIAYDGGKSNDMALAWREPDGIKLLHGDGELGDDYINWGNVFNVTGTNSYSSNPSIAYASGQDFAICWTQSSSGYKIYYTTATENYNPEWIFGATELISPSYWESNINPQITVVDRYHPTIVWTSRNNVVEGGPSVHIKQRSGLGTNDTWGGITSFSHYNSTQNLTPVIGNYSESTKMEILWNFGTYIYKASYNGSNWSGPSILSTSGGNGVNINRNSAWNTYQTKALWEKTDNALAFYNVGNAPLSKIVAFSENEPIKLPYRLNRHAIIELPKDIDSTATGSVCFEMAGISTLYNYSETKVNYSFNEINLLASEPIKVAAPGMQFKFSGAIYGAGLELQNNFVSSISEPLAKVVLKDSKTNETLQSIWVNNPSMLNQVENKTFGEFRNVFVDLNKYLGKTVYAQVEMIGKSKGVKPLIVDDYLILSDSTSIAENLAKKNYTDYSLPTEYTLMQNFPNPFNPSTTITFYLPEAQHTILKIYNVLGKEVMTVVNENLAAGYHSVDINMSNEPSGVYLYSLSAGSFRNTKKLMLMK